jgi:glycosyltransferase involved in cell wall biosynthesis
MICGSCLHDNTLARAMIRRGVDVQLISTYTPIRTDEEDVSASGVFYGGLNVFLSQSIPFFRHLPSTLTRWLDNPKLIRWATNRASATSAKSLGALTVSMLRGAEGNQRRELEQLCTWLKDLRPRLIVFSNMLIAGCIPRFKAELDVPLLVTLQGDDIFLDSLPEPYREQSLTELRRLVPQVDAFLVNSQFYADRMHSMLQIPREQFAIVPLGLDVTGFPTPETNDAGRSNPPASRPPTIGYLARVAPEKGFHLLVDAFLELRQRGTVPDVRLRVAGWQGPQHAAYFQQQLEKIRAAHCEDAFHYAGTVNRQQKVEFLRELDLFSVPTVYADPKGLFALEALAAGIPVVQPNHGAFPELLTATGGGRLVPPNDVSALATGLEQLLLNPAERRDLGRAGQGVVHARFNADAMAADVWEVWQRFLP